MKPVLLLVVACALLAHNALAASQPKEVSGTAPCVSLPELNPDGSQTTVSTCDSSKGGQNLVLEFFATWCEFCNADLPNFTKIAAELGGKAVFRIMDEDTAMSDITSFWASHDHSQMGIVLDTGNDALSAFEVEGTPTTFVIGPDKQIKYTHLGSYDSDADWNELRAAIGQ